MAVVQYLSFGNAPYKRERRSSRVRTNQTSDGPPEPDQQLLGCSARVVVTSRRAGGGRCARQQELITRWQEDPTGGITPATKIPVIAAELGLQRPQAHLRFITSFLESTLRISHVFCAYFDSQSGFMHTVLVYRVENGHITAMDPNVGPVRSWPCAAFEAYGSYNLLYKA